MADTTRKTSVLLFVDNSRFINDSHKKFGKMFVSCFIFSHPCLVKFTTLVHDQFVCILRGVYFVRIHISLLYDFVLVTVRFRGGVRPRSFVQIHMNCATLKIRTTKQKLYEFVRVRLYKFVRISHLVKYVRIAVRSG